MMANKIIPNQNKQFEKSIKNVKVLHDFLMREFYQSRKLLHLISHAKKGNKKLAKKCLKELRGMFGIERVERREGRVFNSMVTTVKSLQTKYKKKFPGEVEKTLKLLEQAKIYHNFFVKTLSRGGKIEVMLKEAEKDDSKLSDVVKVIEDELKKFPSFEGVLGSIESSLNSELKHSMVGEVDLELELEVKIKELDAKIGILQKELKQVRSRFGFTETFLGGIFSSDKASVKREKEIISTLWGTSLFRVGEGIEGEISKLRNKLNKIKIANGEKIHNGLVQFDDMYIEITDAKKKADWTLKYVTNYLKLLEGTLSSLSFSEGLEVGDLFSKNKSISMASSMSNLSSQSMLNNVAKETKQLKLELKNFDLFFEKSDVPVVGLYDSLDLCADLLGVLSFDITSIFTLDNLSKNKAKIRKLKNAATKFKLHMEDECNSFNILVTKFHNSIKHGS